LDIYSAVILIDPICNKILGCSTIWF